MENTNIKVGGLDFEHIGWKYYNQIKKKAMEQGFSWSGLFISLSIAFFIVITSAFLLNILHNSIIQVQLEGKNLRNIYKLESFSQEHYLQTEYLSEKINNIIKTTEIT